MCNLSDYVEEQGYSERVSKRAFKMWSLIYLSWGTVSDEDIMKAGNLSPEELGRIKEELKEQLNLIDTPKQGQV